MDPLVSSIHLLADFVSRGTDLEATLRGLTEGGRAALGVDMAGLTIRDQRGRPRTAAFTDAAVLPIDDVQYDHGRGPCLDAARTHTIFEVPDTRVERRWPEFADAAARLGVLTSLSVPLVVGDHGLGALNLYDHRPGFFDRDRTTLAEAFAGQCSIAAQYWSVANEATNLAAAIASRATIEQAKGVIMATTGCSPEEAFNLLREQSQSENRKLRDIAAEVVARQKR